MRLQVTVISEQEQAEQRDFPGSPTVRIDGLDPVPSAQDPDETRVLEVLSKRPRRIPDLAARAGLSIADATAALGMLSLTGGAVEGPAGWSRA